LNLWYLTTKEANDIGLTTSVVAAVHFQKKLYFRVIVTDGINTIFLPGLPLMQWIWIFIQKKEKWYNTSGTGK